MTHPAAISDEELIGQCDWTRTRSSGPGGQRRNKVETGATLLHKPTGINAQATERRSQEENKRVAIKRLRLALAVEHRAPVTPPRGMDEVASELWRSRRRGGRIVCSVRHRDYPAVLAEAMDVLADSAWQPRKGALRLGVTMSQILKLLRDHPPALRKLNEERAARNLNAMT